MSRRSFRRSVLSIHRWLGLHVCIVLSLIFLTGVILVNSFETILIGNPGAFISPIRAENGLTYGELYETAQNAAPQSRILEITASPRPWVPPSATVRKAGRNFAMWIHPGDGQILAVTEGGGLRDVARGLHDSLLVPLRPVYIAVNSLSLVILTLVTTGLITYRRFWKGWFRPPSRGMDARARRGAWHRLVAVWVAPFLLISSLSSAVFLAESLGIRAEGPQVPDPAAREWRLNPEFDGADLDAVVASVFALVPDLDLRKIKLPPRRNGWITVDGRSPTIGGFVALIDPLDLTVAAQIGPGDGNAMARLKAFAAMVHFGEFGGTTIQVLWTLFGLASTLLLWTGARVFAARILIDRGLPAVDVQSRGTVGVVVEGLGIFKWAYALLFLGLAAMIVLRFIL